MSKFKMVRKLIVVLMVLPIIGIGFMTIAREGITFQSLVANFRAEHAFREIRDGRYDEATDYIGFWGILEENGMADVTKIGEEKERFVTELGDFFSEPNRETIDFRLYDFRTEDGYTTGYTELAILDHDITYEIAIALSFSEDKLCPMRIESIMTDSDGTVDIEEIPNKLMQILRTHYTG